MIPNPQPPPLKIWISKVMKISRLQNGPNNNNDNRNNNNNNNNNNNKTLFIDLKKMDYLQIQEYEY